MGRPVLITPPGVEPITVADAKRQCRVTWDDEDADFTRYIAAARAYVEAELERALISQQWAQSFDGFPANGVRLDRVPLLSVDGVAYVDVDGAPQTLTENEDYVVDAVSAMGWIFPGQSGWPDTFSTINAVTVTYTAGYGADPEDVPDDLRHALFLLVTEMYEVRSPVSIGSPVSVVPGGVERFLHKYRTW